MNTKQPNQETPSTCPVCEMNAAHPVALDAACTCPSCGYHSRLDIRRRIASIADEGTFEEFSATMQSLNPIGLQGYAEKLLQNQRQSELSDAVVTGRCTIDGHSVVLAVMSFQFMGGSMGSVVGEKITQAMFTGAMEERAVIIFTASGGARMQEGIFSLMQMAKTSSAAALLDKTGTPLFIVLTDPTTGGVTASFAMLGDVILAEPGALIGFAGPRVIEGTIKQRLPGNFQRSEFQLEKGFVDAVVPRSELKQTLAYLLVTHTLSHSAATARQRQAADVQRDLLRAAESATTTMPATTLQEDLDKLKASIGAIEKLAGSNQPPIERTSWDCVLLARQQGRPGTLTYIDLMCDRFFEVHGDRLFADDPAMVGGIGLIAGRPVTIIGNRKGTNLKDNVIRNYGMSNPEGYRKALRLAKQAEKFHRPVICFIDTPGAYPGLGSEERGIGEAIARNLREFSVLRTPVLCFVIGEGGSGGALGIGVGDKQYMLENAVYSVITPEGFASILLRDPSKAREAAETMKITARDLKRFGIIHDIIAEAPGGAHTDPAFTAALIKQTIVRDLEVLCSKDPDTLVRYRIKKIRGIGSFEGSSNWWEPLLQVFGKVDREQSY